MSLSSKWLELQTKIDTMYVNSILKSFEENVDNVTALKSRPVIKIKSNYRDLDMSLNDVLTQCRLYSIANLVIPQNRKTNLHISVNAAVNTPLTVTIPESGAGLFHYITKIQLQKRYAIAGVAAGAGVPITSTNLDTANLYGWATSQLGSAAGTVANVIDEIYAIPMKSFVSNIATTITAPAQLQTAWRFQVNYYVDT